jgi:hypothetical protein
VILSVLVCDTLFGPERDEVRGEWRKLHKEELNDLYCLPNIVRVVKSRRMRWAGHVARMGERRDVHRALVGKPEGKRPSGRPRRRWEINIKIDLEEVEGVVKIGWSGLRIRTGGGHLCVR